MLTKKQVGEIKEHLDKAQNPLFFFDNDLDGRVGKPGDYQIDFQYQGGVWEVVSQGWNSEDGYDW